MELLSPESGWLLPIAGFDPERENETEALLSIGNGFAGTRGSLEFGSIASRAAMFLAGVFDPIRDTPEAPQDPSGIPALAVAPNWAALALSLDGEQLDLQSGEVLELQRVLDLKQGLLVSRWRHRLPSGRVLCLSSLRMAMQAARHQVLQRVWILPESSGRLRLTAILDGRAADRFPQSPRLTPVRDAVAPAGTLLLETPHSAIQIAMQQVCELTTENEETPAAWGSEQRPDALHQSFEWQADAGRTYVFDRRALVVTSRDAHHEAISDLRVVSTSTAIMEQQRRWAERWRAADVRIEGDDDLQRAVRFAAYHLISVANPEDERASIGARGLSSEGYNGHVFWDTEIFMLPFYTFTWPAAAHALLMYRFHTLDAARAKAALHGYRGAFYAWESAASGFESTPSSLPDPSGKQLPVYTGQLAYHISADIAHAIWQYWQATGDDEFFSQAGAEVILETARFWASCAQEDSEGRFHIRDVIGPDEDHPHIDDSAYTNAMAQQNLQLAGQTRRWLRAKRPDQWQALRQRLALREVEFDRWAAIAEHLATGYDPRTKLIEEFAGYFGLRNVDLPEEGEARPAARSNLSLDDLARTQLIKQADVALLCSLQWRRFGRAVAAANLDYYEPRTIHDSSLSPSVYALLAARVGRIELARRYFQQCARIDLANSRGSTSAGVHIGNCGGIWQALAFGAAGMTLQADGFDFDPHLLAGWRSLSLAVQWRGAPLEVRIEAASGRIDVTAGALAQPVRISAGPGQRQRLESGGRISLQFPAPAAVATGDGHT